MFGSWLYEGTFFDEKCTGVGRMINVCNESGVDVAYVQSGIFYNAKLVQDVGKKVTL